MIGNTDFHEKFLYKNLLSPILSLSQNNYGRAEFSWDSKKDSSLQTKTTSNICSGIFGNQILQVLINLVIMFFVQIHMILSESTDCTLHS